MWYKAHAFLGKVIISDVPLPDWDFRMYRIVHAHLRLFIYFVTGLFGLSLLPFLYSSLFAPSKRTNSGPKAINVSEWVPDNIKRPAGRGSGLAK